MTFYVAFYKSIHKGFPGVYNRLVRWWTKSQYSHCEIVFSDGLAASSSYMDGGVRMKNITFDECSWDFIILPSYMEDAARDWFNAHLGQPYDLWGNAHFIVGGIGDSRNKWFCSEAIAASLGIEDAWRYDPATLYSALNFNKEPR